MSHGSLCLMHSWAPPRWSHMESKVVSPMHLVGWFLPKVVSNPWNNLIKWARFFNRLHPVSPSPDLPNTLILTLVWNRHSSNALVSRTLKKSDSKKLGFFSVGIIMEVYGGRLPKCWKINHSLLLCHCIYHNTLPYPTLFPTLRYLAPLSFCLVWCPLPASLSFTICSFCLSLSLILTEYTALSP